MIETYDFVNLKGHFNVYTYIIKMHKLNRIKLISYIIFN